LFHHCFIRFGKIGHITPLTHAEILWPATWRCTLRGNGAWGAVSLGRAW
jgi:hypothetical protein